MTIQPIGGESVALYITSADLLPHGFTPETLTADGALVLTRSAFSQAGLPLDGPIEIEAYPNECGVLVFAHVRPRSRLWLSFPDFEALLAALQACPLPAEGPALSWWEGRWWLSLPSSARSLHTALSEYGCTEFPCPQTEARLAEYGQPVADGAALAALPGYFRP